MRLPPLPLPLQKLLETDVWQVFNSEDSWLPFFLPFTIWLGAFLFAPKIVGKSFYHWTALHNLHNVGAMLIGATSLYIQNDRLFNERIGILFSLSYFVVDLVEVLFRRDIPYLFHSIFCIALGTANYNMPILRQLRMNSKASFLEASSPVLHWCKCTRKPLHFILFAITFTLCRIVWIPYMFKQLKHDAGMTIPDPVPTLLACFYALNLYWYYKIIRVLVRGRDDDSSKKESNTSVNSNNNASTLPKTKGKSRNSIKTRKED